MFRSASFENVHGLSTSTSNSICQLNLKFRQKSFEQRETKEQAITTADPRHCSWRNSL